MTIHLPSDMERSIEAAVKSGRFASVDEAMTEAARLLLKELNPGLPAINRAGPDPVLGALRDAAAELDEIVAETYRQRRGDTWRDIDVE